MSILKATDNLLLTLYESSSDLPTYLEHYSDDMKKIDNAWLGHNEWLSRLDEISQDHESRVVALEECCVEAKETLTNHGQRLAIIEDVIATVSTQNINDIIARVDALEHKVEANASQIHEINDNITVINGRIATAEENITANGVAINGLNSRVSVLEECCAEVRDTLGNLDVRITKNTNDISDLILRVERDEGNIAGNANDITILSEQVQTNAHNIDELTHALDDLDPSSQLEIVRQVAQNTSNITSLFEITTAQTSRIDGIITRLGTDETRVTDLERRMTSAEDTLAQIDDWQDTIDAMSERVTELSSDVSDLSDAVSAIDTRVTTLESCCSDMQDYVASNNTRVSALETRVGLIETADIVFDSRLDAIEDDLALIHQTIHDDEDGLAAVVTRVTAIEGDVGNEDISSYGNTVKSAILEAFSRIGTLNTGKQPKYDYDTNGLWLTPTLYQTWWNGLDFTDATTLVPSSGDENKATSGMVSEGIYADLISRFILLANLVGCTWNTAHTCVFDALTTTAQTLVGGINELKRQVDTFSISAIADALHPIGSVYITMGNTNPATLLGVGTWSLLSDGYLRSDAPNASGGSLTTDGHALTISEMPKHNHYVTNVRLGNASGDGPQLFWDERGGHDVNTNYTGGNLPHSHTYEPTYTRVYAWERTA